MKSRDMNPVEQPSPMYIRPVGYPGIPELGIEHIAPLHQVSEGNFTNLDIAEALGISTASVERSFSRLYEYFETSSRVSVWLNAIDAGMIRGPVQVADSRQPIDLSSVQRVILDHLFSENEYAHEELAKHLELSPNQIRYQLESLYGQLPQDVRSSRLGAVVAGIKHQILPSPSERPDLFTGYLSSPLSDYQTRILGILATTDMTQKELAELANTSPQSVNGALIKARTKVAAKSTSEVIRTGIEDKWLPKKNYLLSYPRFEIIKT